MWYAHRSDSMPAEDLLHKSINVREILTIVKTRKNIVTYDTVDFLLSLALHFRI